MLYVSKTLYSGFQVGNVRVVCIWDDLDERTYFVKMEDFAWSVLDRSPKNYECHKTWRQVFVVLGPDLANLTHGKVPFDLVFEALGL